MLNISHFCGVFRFIGSKLSSKCPELCGDEAGKATNLVNEQRIFPFLNFFSCPRSKNIIWILRGKECVCCFVTKDTIWTIWDRLWSFGHFIKKRRHCTGWNRLKRLETGWTDWIRRGFIEFSGGYPCFHPATQCLRKVTRKMASQAPASTIRSTKMKKQSTKSTKSTNCKFVFPVFLLKLWLLFATVLQRSTLFCLRFTLKQTSFRQFWNHQSSIHVPMDSNGSNAINFCIPIENYGRWLRWKAIAGAVARNACAKISNDKDTDQIW